MLMDQEKFALEIIKLEAGDVPPPIRGLTAEESLNAELAGYDDELTPALLIRTKARVIRPPSPPLLEQIANILHRDAVLAAQYQQSEERRLAEALAFQEGEKIVTPQKPT